MVKNNIIYNKLKNNSIGPNKKCLSKRIIVNEDKFNNINLMNSLLKSICINNK